MASKSGQESTSSEQIEELLDTVDKTLERLRTMYEQYFLGIQKQAPGYIHNDVERKLRDLTQLNIRNTGLRYRLATLQQKFGSYNSYWRRTLRQIENGTYTRNLAKIGRDAARSGSEIPEEILAAMPKRMREQVLRDRDQAIAIAKRRKQLEEGEPADDDVAMISDAPAPSDAPKQVKTQRGAHVLHDEGDIDFNELFSAFDDDAPKAETIKPAVARTKSRSRPPIRPQSTSRPPPLRMPVPGQPRAGASQTAGPTNAAAPPSRPELRQGNDTVPQPIGHEPSGAVARPGTGVSPTVRAATQPGDPSGGVPRAVGAQPSGAVPRAVGVQPSGAVQRPGTGPSPAVRAGTQPGDPSGAVPRAVAAQPSGAVQRPGTGPSPTVRAATQPGDPSGAVPRPVGAQPSGAVPRAVGAQPSGAVPRAVGAQPSGAVPRAVGAQPSGAVPRPVGAQPSGAVPRPVGAQPSGAVPRAVGPQPSGAVAGGEDPSAAVPRAVGAQPSGAVPRPGTGPSPAVRAGSQPGVPAVEHPNPRVAPSQQSRPIPVMPGAAAQTGPVAVESMSGPFPRAPSEKPAPTPAPAQRATGPIPRPPTAQPARPTAPLKPPAGMSEADVNALHAKYVKAKEMVGEKVDAGSREKLLKTINQTAPKIMEQYKASSVDFSVVVKDNQVIIKAKPKT